MDARLNKCSMEGGAGRLFTPPSLGVSVGGDFVYARATRAERRAAATCAALVILQFLALFPFGGEPTKWMQPGFLLFPIVLSGTFVTAILAVYFFWQEFMQVGRVTLFLVGCAFLIRGLIPLVQDWPGDPGDISRGSIVGTDAGPFLWLVEHTLFGGIVLVAFIIRTRVTPVESAIARRWVRIASVAIPAAFFASCVWLRGQNAVLPRFVTPDLTRFTDLFVSIGYGTAVLTLAAIVAIGLSTRFRTSLGLWIIASIVAIICEILLMVAFPGRPSIGFWMSRIDALLANSIIAGFFLSFSGSLNKVVVEQRQWLSTVVDNVADALLAIDEHGAILWCNRATEAMFGTTQDHIVGSQGGLWLPAFSASSPRPSGVLQSVAHREDGTVCPVEIASTEFAVNERRLTILIARDVTVRRRGEEALARARDQALRAARSKADFLATMSHEIRTPINAIIGMTELLSETAINAQQREYVQTVQSSAEALRLIINDVLDVSKLEAGKLELDTIPFDPLETTEAAADIVAAQAYKKGLELITFVDPAVPRMVWGDPNRLRQVLLNLLGNAVKFTENGRIVLRTLPGGDHRDVVTLRFEVEDTGIGIAAEAQQRLFAPFEQVDQSTSRRYGGTGLGLSISRRLVALMDGTMGLMSELGMGSTFWFEARFPRVEGEVLPRGVIGRRRVLIVGGDAVWREALTATMQAWDVDVEAAPDGAGALTRLDLRARAGAAFDVAIIESALNDASGVELGRLIASDRRYGNPRAMLVTGFDGPDADDHLESVFSHFLRKPIRQATLFDALAGTPAQTAETTRVVLPPAARSARILLVEDHPVNRQVALRQLERLGYRADVATNGKEALEATARDEYSLILMDCQMPEMDGFDATRAIRKREATTGLHVRIIAMTANAMEGDRETCLAAGMDGYLAKPVRLDDLREVLEQHASYAGSEAGVRPFGLA